MSPRLASAILVGAALLGTSCIRLRWSQAQRFVPIPEEASERLVAGTDDLEACLSRFGAPLYVWERPNGHFAIAYGWAADETIGVRVSVPLQRAVSPSFDYNDIQDVLYGLVLFFGNDGTLQLARRGFLREIAPSDRLPAYLEDA